MWNGALLAALLRLAIVALVSLGWGGVLSAAEKAGDELTYERHVRPIFKAHCFYCHGEGDEQQGGLDLRLQRLMVKGGDSGAAIVPGNLEESHLYQRLVDGDMPPEEIHVRPTAAEIEIIGRWIKSGAKTARPEPENADNLPKVTEEERQFWSFQPVRRPAVPDVDSTAPVRTPIDAFLLAKLGEKDLTFSPETDRRTLIRRVSFTLLGLPPTPDEVAAFLADDEPNAYERLIERMLESPHYGERWARHWLDVAGYADSDGHDGTDPVREDAWPYRDYVINALNADKPLDEFIREQLAGDEMVERPYENVGPEGLEKLIATGFLRTSPDGTSIKDADQHEASNQVVADTIQIISSSLLGVTVHCAQCHDHRFDPILQEDYYRLRAILEPAYDTSKWLTSDKRQLKVLSQAEKKRSDELEAQAKKIEKRFEALQDKVFTAVVHEQIERIADTEFVEREELEEEFLAPLREEPDAYVRYLKLIHSSTGKVPSKFKTRVNTAGLGDLSRFEIYVQHEAELNSLAAEAEALRNQKPKPSLVRALTEVPGQVPVTYLFFRGDIASPQDPVGPGELTVLQPLSSPIPEQNPDLPTTGRRLAYARWLTSGEHPLLARVLVNRVWMHHFGQGIVSTPSDFGVMGNRPTHPELLDWLASELVKNGWSLKHLHRVIMTSTAYRQQSQRHEAGEAADAGNTLYWRMPVRRLESEALRDSILAVSGSLNRKAFGPPVPVTADPDGQIVPDTSALADESDALRRSIYLQVRRTQPLNLIDAFDGPTLDPNCEMRNVSTVPTQALLFLNNEFVSTHASRFADRLLAEAGDDRDAQIARGFQLALARDPSPAEVEKCQAFLNDQSQIYAETMSEEVKVPERVALDNLCQALLAASEFLYID
jgi:hypothetical protein